jgi:hypothetical protein
MDAGGAADESAVPRTAKSCGPDAGIKFLRSKLLGGDGGKQARSPGSAKETVKTIRVRECRVFRWIRGD